MKADTGLCVYFHTKLNLINN